MNEEIKINLAESKLLMQKYEKKLIDLRRAL